jgi:hypothetical protein
MKNSVGQWHTPNAASAIADQMLSIMNSKCCAADCQSAVSQAFQPAGIAGL